MRVGHAAAYSEALDRRARVKQLLSRSFVQAAAGEDANMLEAGGIEPAAG